MRRLTLCKHQTVLLDEWLKSVLGKLVHIAGRGQGRQRSQTERVSHDKSGSSSINENDE